MNVWEEFKKALKQAIDSFCDTFQNFIKTWEDACESMEENNDLIDWETIGENRVIMWNKKRELLKQNHGSLQDVLEYINSKIHPKQHFPNPPKKLIPNYTEPFRTIRRIARSDC